MRWILLLCLFLAVGCDNPTTLQKAISPADFPIISKGEVVNLESHLAKNAVTVFDFYADWCPPCKKLDLSLADLSGVYDQRMAVKKLDLVDWQSDLAKHFQIKDLPYLIVYDEQGKLFDKGPSNQVLPKLIKHLNQ